MSYKISRRNFIKLTAGTGLTIGINLSLPVANANESSTQNIFSPSIWLDISKDNKVTVTIAESEMGQGVFTTLSMMVAEELDASWDQMHAVHADAKDKYGNQATGGSSSLRSNWEPLRMAGAAAKAILISAAAKQWGIETTQCIASEGKITNTATKEQMTFGQLVEFTSDIPLPEKVLLKSKQQFTIIGQPVPRLDSPEKTNGTAKFGNDIVLPDSLIAIVIHPPIIGGSVESINKKNALSITGVKYIFKIKEGVAIVAQDYWSAHKASQEIDIKWKNTENIKINSQHIDEILRKDLNDLKSHKIEINDGDAENIISSSKDKVQSEYFINYQAHASMEPMTCTAYVHDGECEIWVPTQVPTRTKDLARSMTQSAISRLAYKYLKYDNDNVNVHTTMIGGSFGRKLQVDFVSEAIQISSYIQKPVRLFWERSEDIKNDYYHPATLHNISATLNDNGMPFAWWHKASGQKQKFGGAFLQYSIPNVKIQGKRSSLPINIGPWRSVSHHYNAFVVESFIDELAHKANIDPLEYRLKLIDDPQFITVLKAAAKKANWGGKLPKGHYQGIATHKGFGSYVAEVVELSVNPDNSIKIHKIFAAIDAGIVINPDTVKAQMESAIVFGLSAALYGKITFKDGSAEQSNYHDFPVLKYSEMPEVETIIIDSDKNPEGIGEPGVPSLAPAVANAYFAATGIRKYSIPFF